MPIIKVDPIPPTDKVWRYMDLAKFIELLKSQSLYLSSVPTMEDEWEGALAENGDDTTAAELAHLNTFGGTIEQARNFIEFGEQSNAARRACVFINCWHRSDIESAAMWKLYEPSGRGIAVQTTIAALSESATDDMECNLVAVKYVDFDSDQIEPYNYNRIYSYKRKSFEHEREVRLQHFDLMPLRSKSLAEMAMNPPLSERLNNVDYENVIDYNTLPAGKHFSVDLKTLVHRVVIAPEAPKWFIEIVRDVVAKYGQTFSVEASSMLKRPRYSHLL